jgi:hypothetical protein
MREDHGKLSETRGNEGERKIVEVVRAMNS